MFYVISCSVLCSVISLILSFDALNIFLNYTLLENNSYFLNIYEPPFDKL